MGTGDVDTGGESWLFCRIRACLCALPVARVIEVMRPLPIEPLSGMPRFVRGLCVIRGSPVPVIDGSLLLGGGDGCVGRMVTLRVGDRIVALTAEQVTGIQPIEAAAANRLPPLLQNAAGGAVETIRALDGELLLLLDTLRIIPEAWFDELDARSPPGSAQGSPQGPLS
jgi:purine-binding chemotaxis protein CheW